MNKKKFLSNVALALSLAIIMLIGGNVKTTSAKTTQDQVIVKEEVKDFKKSYERVNNSITVTKSNVIFDKNKASVEGFTDEEINQLESFYDEINVMIKNHTASIIKTNNGGYDIKVNSVSEQAPQTHPSVITSRWYGWDFWFSAGQCADAAAIAAGGAAVAAAAAGVLGLTGHIPSAIALTVAAGVLGVGSAYLWYCSNRNGLSATYKYGIGFSCSRND